MSISSDGNIAGSVGLSSSAAANTTAGSAEADSDAGTIQGADLGALSIGGIGDVAGSVSFGSSAAAGAVNGAANAATSMTLAEGLNADTSISVSSDASLSGLATTDASADAATTAGAATANALSTGINGADFAGSTVGIGGIGSLAGQANFSNTATSSNVSLASSATASNDSGNGLIGGLSINVASDATLTGMAIGSLGADASSTAGTATANAGQSDSAVGAVLPSLTVGGIGNITGAAQRYNTLSASPESLQLTLVLDRPSLA